MLHASVGYIFVDYHILVDVVLGIEEFAMIKKNSDLALFLKNLLTALLIDSSQFYILT